MDKDNDKYKLKLTNTIFMIIEVTSGILMFAGKSLLWGTIAFMFSVFFQCLILLATIASTSGKTTRDIMNIMYEKGAFLFVYILTILGVYVYCIWTSNENIKDEAMPSQWTWYSWIIAIIMLVFITPILNKQITNAIDTLDDLPDVLKSNQQNGYIAGHILFIFVYIQYIISIFYQTDGFRV